VPRDVSKVAGTILTLVKSGGDTCPTRKLRLWRVHILDLHLPVKGVNSVKSIQFIYSSRVRNLQYVWIVEKTIMCKHKGTSISSPL